MEEKVSVSERVGIPGSTIKWIAILTMFIDHVGAVIVERYLVSSSTEEIIYNAEISEWFPQYGFIYILDIVLRIIGRMAFPLFIFLLVQGFTHTHDKKAYALRLAMFALISEIPFNLAIGNSVYYEQYQSVFITLLLGFLFMCWDDFLKNKVIPKAVGIACIEVSSLALAFWVYLQFFGSPLEVPSESIVFSIVLGVVCAVLIMISQVRVGKNIGIFNTWRMAASLVGLAVLMFAADRFYTDYGGLGVLAIAAAYAFRNDKKKSIIGCCSILTIFNFFEIFAFADVLVIKKYNGRKGSGLKYLFYAFYPVHLFILHVVSHLLGFAGGNWWGL